ncbi:MAG: hypothetical protein WCE54_15235 [Ignavibacteriaceae bacterium]
MKNLLFKIILLLLLFIPLNTLSGQEQEPVKYFQMEPLDDSLFVKIQQEVFIDPPDPKAEIIVDLRDPNNQNISIGGTLYPFLAFTPPTRAKIEVYPFKINLEHQINFGSVFTEVAKNLNLNKIISPPTLHQISSTLYYINPFFQLFGGERLGMPIKSDIGISFGLGTPYSGTVETNWIEANFHLLGFRVGAFSSADGVTDLLNVGTRYNNLYVPGLGFQVGYVLPVGNFFEISYQGLLKTPTNMTIQSYLSKDTNKYTPKVITHDYFSWELRYPISILGSTRSKFYIAKFVGELHFGFTGREISLGGSTFDFRFDAMTHSDERQPEYLFELLVQRIFDKWAFSAFAVGPSVMCSTTKYGGFGIITLFINARIKLGTSL